MTRTEKYKIQRALIELDGSIHQIADELEHIRQHAIIKDTFDDYFAESRKAYRQLFGLNSDDFTKDDLGEIDYE